VWSLRLNSFRCCHPRPTKRHSHWTLLESMNIPVSSFSGRAHASQPSTIIVPEMTVHAQLTFKPVSSSPPTTGFKCFLHPPHPRIPPPPAGGPICQDAKTPLLLTPSPSPVPGIDPPPVSVFFFSPPVDALGAGVFRFIFSPLPGFCCLIFQPLTLSPQSHWLRTPPPLFWTGYSHCRLLFFP